MRAAARDAQKATAHSAAMGKTSVVAGLSKTQGRLASVVSKVFPPPFVCALIATMVAGV